MAGDENRIEIIIDAAETKSAAKSATEANQRLSEFRKALDAFKNGVGDLNKTIETNTTTVANFNSFLQDFSTKLNDNLSKMQESVIKDFEPRLEKNLENMVARAINKVEAKTSAPGKESRSRSEPKAGAGVPSSKVASVKQPEGYEKPDVQVKSAFEAGTRTIVDGLTGKIKEITNERATTKTTRVETWQEEIDGEIHTFSRTIHEGSTAIRKNINGQSDTLREYRENLKNINRLNTQGFAGFDAQAFNNIISRPYDDSAHQAKLAADERKHQVSLESHLETVRNKTRLSTQGFMGFDAEKFNALASKPYDTTIKKDKKGEKSNNWADPSNMMRREITGALIALHVMKVVAGNSQVAASGFSMISNAVGHLLNVALLPMIPIFSVFAQLIHQVANVINSMPYGIRILIGGLLMWKATSTLIASMPIRDFTSGIRDMRAALSGGGDNLRKFGELVKGFIAFMNSGLQQGRLQGLAEWVGGKIRGKRAGGGPVGASNAYIVGEKGPELFVPDSSGTIVPNSAFRADGGGVEPGGGLPFGDILGNLGAGLGAGGLTYLLTGSPLLAGGVGAGAAMLGPAGIAQAMSGIISSEIGQKVIGSLNVLTGVISSLFAPLAPIFGILSVALGVVTGMKAGGGGGDRAAETTAKVGTAINSTVARGNFGIQSSLNAGAQGTNKMLSLLLLRLNGCIQVAPCAAAVFPTAPIGAGDPTATPDATRTSILEAIREIPGKLKVTLGEFITDATVKVKSVWEKIPLPEAISDRIAKIRSVWEPTPAPEPLADRTAKVVYNIETVGEKPVVVDTAAKIRYNIETIGSAPVAQDVTAKIKYNIETIGTVPTASDAEVKVRYIAEMPTTTTVPDITAKIKVVAPPEQDIKIELAKTQTLLERNPLKANYWLEKPTPEQYNRWLEEIGKVATDKPPKIAATVEVAAGSKITIPEGFKAEVPAELRVPRGTKIVLPDGVSANVPLTVESAPDKLAASINEAIAETVRSGKKFTFPAAAEVNGYVNKAGDVYLNAKATITDFSKGAVQNVEVDATAKIVRAVNKGGEVYIEVFAKDGEIKGIKLAKTYIDVAPSEKSLLTFNEIIAKRAGTVNVPVKPEVPAGADPLKGISWGEIGKSAGGLVGVGLFAALDEFARTGKVNWLPLTASLTTAFVLWTGAEMALTGIATSLGGAAAGAAVSAAMGTVGAALVAAMLVPMAAMFAGDFYKGIENAVNQGSFTPGVFDNFALKAAAEAGQSFGKWLNDWLDKNLNIDLSGAIGKMAKGENGWLIDLLQGGVASAISLTLGPTAGLAFNKFIDDMQRTLSGGIPVDVKMDVESVTQTIKSIASTVHGDGTYTYNPTGTTQPLGTNPTDPTGKPIQGPLKPDGSFALGGPVAAGGLYLVGEKGPELFAPDVGGTIIPNNKIGGGGGGSNVTNHFTFNVTTNNPRELTETVMRELKMELARVKM